MHTQDMTTTAIATAEAIVRALDERLLDSLRTRCDIATPTDRHFAAAYNAAIIREQSRQQADPAVSLRVRML